MSALREAAQQALEALEYAQQDRECPSTTHQAITALSTALAQEQAEPLNLSDRAVQRRLAAQWGHVPAERAEPAQKFKPTPLTQEQMDAPLKAEPAQEPVARECSDPMCACRGGPCAGCEEGQREKEIEDLRSSLDFYQRRCEALRSWQSKMRNPERTIVCDILANGFTLDPAFAGDRYTAPPKAEPAQEPVAWRISYPDDPELGFWFAEGVGGQGCLNEPLYTAPPRRTMVPLTDEEILAVVGWERAEMYMKLTPNFPVDEAKKETLKNARVVEKASWEKNHG